MPGFCVACVPRVLYIRIETLEMLHVIIFLHVTIFSESRTSYVKLCTRNVVLYTHSFWVCVTFCSYILLIYIRVMLFST